MADGKAPDVPATAAISVATEPTSTEQKTAVSTGMPGSSWADEVSSPVVAKPEGGLPQSDGSVETPLGNAGLNEPNYDVEVKLADMQADPNNPLFSIKTFEDLGL
jgi:hypothetical protein